MPLDEQQVCQLPTPFAQASWEPRFAIDALRTDSAIIRRGLECYIAVVRTPFGIEDDKYEFVGFIVSPTRLAVTCRSYSFPHPLSKNPRFEGISIAETAKSISQWLETEAQYPKQPWFDGGEARGFQMYHVAYRQQPRECYGYTLVEPKWFEIHK